MELLVAWPTVAAPGTAADSGEDAGKVKPPCLRASPGSPSNRPHRNQEHLEGSQYRAYAEQVRSRPVVAWRAAGQFRLGEAADDSPRRQSLA